MSYFDQQQFLSLEPMCPKNMDEDITHPHHFSDLPSLIRHLQKNKKFLEEHILKFEALLDIHFYHTTTYTRDQNKLLCRILLKQLVIFIKQNPKDTEQVIEKLSEFVTNLKDSDYNYNSIENLKKVYQFKFNKQKIFTNIKSINILSELIHALAFKIKYFENPHQEIFSEKDIYLINQSQSSLFKNIESHVWLLLNYRHKGHKPFNLIRKLYDDNQIAIVTALLSLSREKRVEYYNVLTKIRRINQQRIADNKYNVEQPTHYFVLGVHQMISRFHSHHKTFHHKITLIGIDRLEDIANKPLLSKKTHSYFETSQRDDVYKLILCKLTIKHPKEYVRLKNALELLANDETLHLKYRMQAMLFAYDILDVVIENHHMIVIEMSNPKQIFNQYWINSFNNQSREITNGYFKKAGEGFFHENLFTLADILACVDKPQFFYRTIAYLKQNITIHIANKDALEEIYTKLQPMLINSLNTIKNKQCYYRPQINELNTLLLEYPLAVSEQYKILNAWLNFSHRCINDNFEIFSNLADYLLPWQEKIQLADSDFTSIIQKDELHGGHWSSTNIHCKNNSITPKAVYAELISCGLLKKDCDISDTITERAIYVAIGDNIAYFCRDKQSLIEYGFSNCFDLLAHLLALVNIHIKPAQKDTTQKIFTLNKCPKVTIIIPDQSFYFQYDSIVYEFITYDELNQFAFMASIANIFLEKINHAYRLYRFPNVDYDTVIITSAKYVQYEKINQIIKMPIQQITWDKNGFTPEDFGKQCELINPRYQTAVDNGFISIGYNLIYMPKSSSPDESAKWLIKQIPHVIAVLKIHMIELSQSNLSLQETLDTFWSMAVSWLNLLIALARITISDIKVINIMYRIKPLWHDKKQQQIYTNILTESDKQDLESLYNFIAMKLFDSDEIYFQVSHLSCSDRSGWRSLFP